MILLDLFLTFLKIGAVSFGGGYGMISLISEEVVNHNWLTEGEFMNFIAVAESTPGPIAVNMATFIGSSQAGILGSLLATLGVVLPSFIIILLISAVFFNLLKYAGVKWALKGVKAVVAGLITATGLTMAFSCILGTKTINTPIAFDYKALIVFVAVWLIAFLFSKFKKKKLSPIILIVISAVMGILLYAF